MSIDQFRVIFVLFILTNNSKTAPHKRAVFLVIIQKKEPSAAVSRDSS